MDLTRNEVQDLQVFMTNVFSLSIKKPNSDQVQCAKEWFEDAKSELKAYKVLKRNNLYPQMIEHLSLCVEKLVKSLGFIYSSVDQNSVKQEIGHISPRVFIKIIENTNTTDFLQKNFEQYRDLNMNENYQKVKGILMSRKKVQTFEKQNLTLKKEHIDFLFQIIDNIIIKIKLELKDKTVEDAYEKNHSAKQILSPIMPIVKKTKEWKQVKDKKLTLLYKMPALHMNLFLLSVVLFPFYNVSRYNRSYGVKFEKGLGVIDSIDLLEERVIKSMVAVSKQITSISQSSQ